MKKRVLIVEDQFIEANDLQLMLTKAGYEVCGIARSVPIAQEIIKAEKPELVLLDIFLKGKLTGIDLARELKEENIAFIYLSANSNEDILAAAKTTEPYGFLVKPFRERDLLVTLEIAQYRHEHSRESKHRREAELMKELEKLLASEIEWNVKLLEAGKLIQQEIPFDYLSFGMDTSFLRVGFNEYQSIGLKELSTIGDIPVSSLTRILDAPVADHKPSFLNSEAFEKLSKTPSLNKISYDKLQMRSLLTYPILAGNEESILLRFYSRRPDSYGNEHIALLDYLRPIFTRIAEQTPAVESTSKPIARVAPPVSSPVGFKGIIGSSHLLLKVFDHVAQVAPFDTSVLILGESGTGKERIADSIHNLSSRKAKPLVKVNCATLPANLIESELFGHEKGSFTGATEKRIGKFEQANGGTIFLDEIGEMPVDLQVKLLRVLQEKEIEPLGGRSSVKIDVRVIAATNRNLEKEVGEGRFRLDLYYRLNVFPIALPSLRERIEDIPELVNHFINVYNRKSGKNVSGVSDRVLKSMIAYTWPGNIRELENLLERGVLLAKGTVIEDISLPTRVENIPPGAPQDLRPKTIHENERDYIVSVLKKCKGKIWGIGGAAEVLNLPPSTLKSKMKKLNIEKENIG